jgi:hypothetical protein
MGLSNGLEIPDIAMNHMQLPCHLRIGITDTACQNSLLTDIFEALQIFQSAYHNQHVTIECST